MNYESSQKSYLKSCYHLFAFLHFNVYFKKPIISMCKYQSSIKSKIHKKNTTAMYMCMYESDLKL